jgi:murein DD-endopeptidase MepM/ murein hydrolase activator NlpD
MRLIPPLKGIKSRPLYPQSDDIYFTQHYGNVWIADRDMVINGKQIKAGDNVYQVAFGMPFHNGDDIAAPLGTEIIACHNARVIESVTKDTGLGLRVCIAWEADGFTWVAVHGHLQKSAFPEIPWNFDSQVQVQAGEAIGFVNSTGFSTGNHLHFMGYQYKDGIRLNTNNGVNGAITLWPYVKENFMEPLQVLGEQTIVLKNLDGKFLQVATSPELYPTVAKIFGLEGHTLESVTRAEVDANLVGEAQAGINFRLL